MKKICSKYDIVFLEDDNNDEVDFNGETLTFTLQMIKI